MCIQMTSWPPESSPGIGQIWALRPSPGAGELLLLGKPLAEWTPCRGSGPALNLQTWYPWLEKLGGCHLMPVPKVTEAKQMRQNGKQLQFWIKGLGKTLEPLAQGKFVAETNVASVPGATLSLIMTSAQGRHSLLSQVTDGPSMRPEEAPRQAAQGLVQRPQGCPRGGARLRSRLFPPRQATPIILRFKSRGPASKALGSLVPLSWLTCVLCVFPRLQPT